MPKPIKQCPICGGIFKYYDGCLGYESLVCNTCNTDIQMLSVFREGNEIVVINKGTRKEKRYVIQG